jgi:hypothetical protein
MLRVAERQRMREQRDLLRNQVNAADHEHKANKTPREWQQKQKTSKKNATQMRKARKERARKAAAGGDKMDIG